MDERRIDRVAREMTEATPPADLRARVLSRIAQGERTKKPLAWRLAPAAIALATAAALVATVWPRWQAEVPVQNQSAVASPPSTGAGTGAIPPEPGPASTAPPATSPVLARRTAPVARSADPVGGPDTIALALPPLTVAAISDEPIAMLDSPAIASLEVSTLGVTGLEIEPLAYQGDFQ